MGACIPDINQIVRCDLSETEEEHIDYSFYNKNNSNKHPNTLTLNMIDTPRCFKPNILRWLISSWPSEHDSVKEIMHTLALPPQASEKC